MAELDAEVKLPEVQALGAFDLLPTLIRAADADGSCTFFNRAWVDFTGRSAEQDRGMGWIEAIHPDDRDRSVAEYLDAVGNGRAFTLTYRLRRGDGEYRHYLDQGAPQRDGSGALVGFVACCTDVTEQQRAETALREARERYRAFVQTSAQAIWRFELDRPVDSSLSVDQQVDAIFRYSWLAECNEAMSRLYGHETPETLIGARLPELVPPGDPQNRDFIRRFVESGYRLTAQESHDVDRTGQPRIFINNFVGVLEHGRLVRVWGTELDITPQRDQEILLRQSDERLRVALGAAGMGTWRMDLRTRLTTHDSSLNRIFGLGDRETTGPMDEQLTKVVHPDDRERVSAAMARALRENADYSVEMRIVRPDGAIRWIRDRGRVLTDGDGRPLFFTGAVMDITEQRRAEEHERALAQATAALASSLNYEQTLADVARGLVPRLADGCVVHFVTEEGLKRMAEAGDTSALPDEVQLYDVARDGAPAFEDRLMIVPLRAGGRVFGAISFVSIHPWRRFDEADHAVATEVGDRVALSVDHARLFRDLQQAGRLKDEFLATLSHELRTPLNAVLGWTRMLRRGTVPPERTRAVLETIERNAAAQMQLVEELLDLSAMVAGGLRLGVTRVDLREVVGGAVETIRPAAEAKSLHVTLSIDGAVNEIAADPGRIRQVLWNLLSNAVKFTPPDGEIAVTVTEEASDLEITIRDSGKGISAEFLPFVFEPFRQADSSSSRQVGGLGLGLAIVRHIVEAHGGTVTAQSDGPGRGSVFVVRLPTGRVPQAEGEVRELGSLRGRRVLAVDDDESTQELVATMLLMYGVSVRTAGRATEALDVLSKWRPDVLLTDLAMPGEDGYALMRRVRAMPPPLGGIPAVALTAYTDPQSVQNAFAAGFDAHLGKPLEPHVLADALVKVLRARRTRA